LCLAVLCLAVLTPVALLFFVLPAWFGFWLRFAVFCRNDEEPEARMSVFTSLLPARAPPAVS
jgi:hypothetical protein